MQCSRCASDAGIETSAPVAVGALVCPECGSPIDDGASGAVISTILAQLDRFGLSGRSAPLLEPRREEG